MSLGADNLSCHVMTCLFLLTIQVFKAKVLQCNPNKEKMLLSFKAVVDEDTGDAAVSQFYCEVGKVSS